jgi:hypothetical protein
MTLYSLALFAHVVAVLLLFAALSFEVLALLHLRRASTPAEARLWLDAVPGLPALAMGSLLVVFVTGIYLTVLMAAGNSAWPKVTVAALVLVVGPLGAISGRRMGTIRRTCASDTANKPELLGRLQDPFLKISISVRIAVTLGIVLLMGAKPGTTESLGIVGASAILGLLWALVMSVPGNALPAAADFRDSTGDA